MSALSIQFNGQGKKTTTITDAGTDEVLGPVDVQSYTNLGFYLYNSLAGGDDITSVTLETAPEISGPWVEVATLNAADIAAEAMEYSAQIGVSFKFIRVLAACGAGDTTKITTWLCATNRA